jgi:2'-hydroxyisoflavone reductase
VKILIIGGTQFIGRHLSFALLKAGHQVVLFHRNKPVHSEFSAFKHIIGDRRLPLDTKLAGDFDLLIDTCAFEPVDLDLLSSISFRKYVFISSVAVYGSEIPEGQMEDAAKISTDAMEYSSSSVNSYGQLKKLTEDLVVDRYPNSIILRPSVVIGPGDNSGRLEKIFERHVQGNSLWAPFSLDNSLVTQFIDVRDLVQLSLEIISRGLTGSFNLVGKTTKWNDFLSSIAAVAGLGLMDKDCEVFPLWDTTKSRGLRTLQSSYNFIREYNFTALEVSLEDWFCEYQNSAKSAKLIKYNQTCRGSQVNRNNS